MKSLLLLVVLLSLQCHAIDVTVGPVIGKTTENSTRILLEINGNSTATVVLRSLDTNELGGQVAIKMEENLPYIFVFEDLKPSTTYQVVVLEYPTVSSSVRTMPVNAELTDRLKFVVISCNRIWYTQNEVNTKDDVWLELSSRVMAGEFTYALHLGDQIYSDDWGEKDDAANDFAKLRNLLSNRDRTTWEALIPTIKNQYASIYRRTWGHPAQRAVLANIPNIMFGDDHEMADDLGDLEAHNDIDSPDYFIFRIARDVFMMYQRQLWTNITDVHKPNIPIQAQENHMHWTLGEYGFMTVDSRYAKYFKGVQDDPLPFLTTSQWGDITTFLAPGGPTENVKAMIVATQIPIVLFESKATEAGEALFSYANDLRGMWEYRDNQAEQTRLLNDLKRWRDQNRNVRKVTLVGGDVHLAGYGLIAYDKDDVVFQQMVVGPVSGDKLGSVGDLLLSTFTSIFHNLEAPWTFEHFRWQSRRNVGILTSGPDHDYYMRVTHLLSYGQTGAEVLERRPSRDTDDDSLGGSEDEDATIRRAGAAKITPLSIVVWFGSFLVSCYLVKRVW
eukprot:TRINITY_DN68237_c0_g1_i1.p1 TRINITY_DN68237_c0_g1~~TRINITY_DN68237_c0_g1_i1.p1  ORF type:complete len:559 (+),score=37.85 TRINITY_DN68237_c0_g1_i1:132-1808(+)